jgi:hypothetical protein
MVAALLEAGAVFYWSDPGVMGLNPTRSTAAYLSFLVLVLSCLPRNGPVPNNTICHDELLQKQFKT